MVHLRTTLLFPGLKRVRFTSPAIGTSHHSIEQPMRERTRTAAKHARRRHERELNRADRVVGPGYRPAPAPSTPTTMAHHLSDARERPWAQLLLNSRRSTGWPVISAMSSKSLSVVPGLGFRPARRSGGPEPMEPCAGRVGRGCPVLRSLGVRMRVWHRPGASATAVVLRARRASRSRPGCQPQRGCAS